MRTEQSQENERFAAPKRQPIKVFLGTINLAQESPKECFYREFLGNAKSYDFVCVSAQEGSYQYSNNKEIVKANAFKVMSGNRAMKHSEKRIWKTSRMQRFIGSVTGGVAAAGVSGPLAPVGFVVGLVGGYYGAKKYAEEQKCRKHWFECVEACLNAGEEEGVVGCSSSSRETRNESQAEEDAAMKIGGLSLEDGDGEEKEEYVLVQSEVLMQMRLSVHCKKRFRERIKSVRVGVKATGIGNVLGNKGGLMIEIQFYGGESLAFIGCHLAAHEEKKFYERRIESIRTILKSCWRDKEEKPFGAEGIGASWEQQFKSVAEASGLMSGDSKSNKKKKKKKETTKMTTKTLTKREEERKQKRLPPDLELLESATHTFFMGDLNFRVDPGPTQEYDNSTNGGANEVIGKDDDDIDRVWNSCWSKTDVVKNTSVSRRSKVPGEVSEDDSDDSDSNNATSHSSPFQTGYDFVVDKIKQKDWSRLWIGDQLLHAQRQGKCLFGFQELPLQFPPSFKRNSSSSTNKKEVVESGFGSNSSSSIGRTRLHPITEAHEYYTKKRVPSYTDRVLIKSLPGFEANRKAHKYQACHGVTTSDHAPVFATFSVNLLQGITDHEDVNDDVLESGTKELDYFANINVEKIEFETYDDRLLFSTVEEQKASFLKVHLGKLATNALEIDDFEAGDDSRWSNAKKIENIIVFQPPNHSFGEHEDDDEEESARLKSRSSCTWIARTLRRDGEGLIADALPVVKLPSRKGSEHENKPYYVIFTVVNEKTNARLATAIVSVPTDDGKRFPFEADCTSCGRVIGKLRGDWRVNLKAK